MKGGGREGWGECKTKEEHKKKRKNRLQEFFGDTKYTGIHRPHGEATNQKTAYMGSMCGPHIYSTGIQN
jgi:hypothetical protein